MTFSNGANGRIGTHATDLVAVFVQAVVAVASWTIKAGQNAVMLTHATVVLHCIYRLKMRWVDAGAYVAKMIDMQPWRNRPNQEAVRVAVRGIVRLWETAVGVKLVNAAHPKPARAKVGAVLRDGAKLINPLPEIGFVALRKGAFGIVRRAVRAPAFVVLWAKATASNKANAIGDSTLVSHRNLHSFGVTGRVVRSYAVPLFYPIRAVRC